MSRLHKVCKTHNIMQTCCLETKSFEWNWLQVYNICCGKFKANFHLQSIKLVVCRVSLRYYAVLWQGKRNRHHREHRRILGLTLHIWKLQSKQSSFSSQQNHIPVWINSWHNTSWNGMLEIKVSFWTPPKGNHTEKVS